MKKENIEALSYFYTLLDDAEAVLTGDEYRESVENSEYIIKFLEDVKVDKKEESIDFCRKCPLWQSKTYDEYYNPEKAKVVFIVSKKEIATSVFSPETEEIFEKEMTVLNLNRSDRAVISIINCPTPSFDSRYAEQCKIHLKSQIEKLDPKYIVILGQDAARFLTRIDDFEKVRASKRLRPFKFLSRDAFITYSSEEYRKNRAFRVPLFEDLKKIKECII